MEGPQCHLGSREPCDAFQELPGASGPAVVAAPHCKVVVDEIDEVQDETATVGEIQKEVLEDKGVVVVYTQVMVVLAEVGRDDVVQDSGVHHDSGKHLEVWLAQGVAYILVVDQSSRFLRLRFSALLPPHVRVRLSYSNFQWLVEPEWNRFCSSVQSPIC